MGVGRFRLVAIGAIVALTMALLVLFWRADRSRDLVLRVEPLDNQAPLTVHVAGAVDRPGLYTLPAGSRVAQAVELAGLSQDADESRLSLAALLMDGQTVEVPEKSSEAIRPLVGVGVEPAVMTATSATRLTGEPLNINLADAHELELLPGIGPALAQRIVEYRTANGLFSTVEELEDIQGISLRMVEEMRHLITVDA